MDAHISHLTSALMLLKRFGNADWAKSLEECKILVSSDTPPPKN
jgi:hypothetical protein